MSGSAATSLSHASSATDQAPRHSGHLFHPVKDFVMAGGASSIMALAVVWLIRDKVAAQPTAIWLTLVMSVFSGTGGL